MSRPPRARARRRRAVVLGGRIAGVLAARVLASHYEHVVVIDRFPAPDAETAAASTKKRPSPFPRAELLTAHGLADLERLWPGIRAELVGDGASFTTTGPRRSAAGDLIGWHDGGPVLGATRSFVEARLRRRMIVLDNVTVLGGLDALGLVADGSRCVGVRVLSRNQSSAVRTLDADLVVDAMGSESRLCHWLADGWGASVPVDGWGSSTRYLGRLYQLPRFAAPRIEIGLAGSDTPYRVAITTVENGWRAVSVRCLAEPDRHSEADQAAAMVGALGPSEVAGLIGRGVPMGPWCSWTAPLFTCRRFDHALRLPDGVLALGSSVCGTDPLDKGLTTEAARQAHALDRALASPADPGWGDRSRLITDYFTTVMSGRPADVSSDRRGKDRSPAWRPTDAERHGGPRS